MAVYWNKPNCTGFSPIHTVILIFLAYEKTPFLEWMSSSVTKTKGPSRPFTNQFTEYQSICESDLMPTTLLNFMS